MASFADFMGKRVSEVQALRGFVCLFSGEAEVLLVLFTGSG